MADPGASPLIGGRGPVGSGLATGIDPCHQLAMGTVAFCPLNPSPVTSSGHLGSISGAWVLSTPYSTKKSRLMPELAPVIEAPGLGRGFGSSTPAPSSPFSQKHTSASRSLRDGDFLSQTLRPPSSWALGTPRPHAEVTGRGPLHVGRGLRTQLELPASLCSPRALPNPFLVVFVGLANNTSSSGDAEDPSLWGWAEASTEPAPQGRAGPGAWQRDRLGGQNWAQHTGTNQEDPTALRSRQQKASSDGGLCPPVAPS